MLVASKVCSAQQEQIVEPTLVLPGFLLPVILKPLPAQHVHDFTLLTGLLKVFTAGAAIGFRFGQLFLQSVLALCQDGTAKNVKLQLRCADSGFALRGSPGFDISDLVAHVLDLLPQHRNPVIGCLQPQLLLTF
jgi:hypothetical protein